MNLRLTRVLAAAAILIAGAGVAKATNVTWTINSTASSFTLKIPDQNVSVSGNTINVRVRNQNGSAWTTNKAAISGTVATDYNEVLQQRIQFIGGQTNMTGVNSGSYRPNPAAWNLTVANNSYQNTSTTPGTIGGLIRGNALVIFNFDIAAINIFDILFDAQSNFLPIAGTTINLQANGGLNFGGQSGKISADGGSLPLGLGDIPDVLPDDFDLGVFLNKSSVGTITNTGGLTRHIVIPIQQNFSIDLSGQTVVANTVATLVLDAVVPEPSMLMLAGLGLVSFAVCARRRLLGR